MEFWIGLSAGMHLGKLIAEYLEKIGKAYGLLDSESLKNAEEKIQRRSQLVEIVDELERDL